MIRIHHKPRNDAHSDANGNGAPRLLFNWVSLGGGILTVCGLTGTLFLIIMNVFSHGEGGGYVGLTVILPIGVYLIGLILFMVGLGIEKKHRGSGKQPTISGHWSLALDLDLLTRPKVVWSVGIGALVLTLGVLSVGAGSLKFIEYTESNEFCASTCHQVMGPEAVTHQNSPHAQVHCVKCHVGEGADGYLRAKLNGTRQLYGVVSGDYNRPIPTPIHDRRPSSEMCESCHWKDRFIDYKVLSRQYFHADEESTPAEIKFMIKIGGGGNRDGLIEGAGIHYHMLTENKVEYIARDEETQDIAWVRETHADGSTIEFNNTEDPLSDEEKQTLPIHEIECIDCHSRPAHQFAKPVESVNNALSSGALSRELPYIKREGVRLLAATYADTDEAIQKISNGLTKFYQDEYPNVRTEHSKDLAQGITTLQEIYRQTIFPEMKADWAAHPDNIGHRDSPGCFRCHNEEMQSDNGKVIFTNCNKCHIILAQANGGQVVEAQSNFKDGQPFQHLEDDSELDEYTTCTDCHDGGFGAYED